jgi:hypothetical protein
MGALPSSLFAIILEAGIVFLPWKLRLTSLPGRLLRNFLLRHMRCALLSSSGMTMLSRLESLCWELPRTLNLDHAGPAPKPGLMDMYSNVLILSICPKYLEALEFSG